MTEFGVVCGLLAVVAVLATVGRRIGMPDPVMFAIGGLALAILPGIPVVGLPPSLVLVVFLPPLIFAAAQDTSWAEIRRDARAVLLLAVGLVLVTMSAVAVVAHELAPELTWPAAFALGAIVSPPDTVAAKAIADTLHLPRRLVAILEGEGLMNDATALVAFQVASGVAVAGAIFSLESATLRVMYAAAASVAIGVVVGWLGRRVSSLTHEPSVQNTVALLLPFAAFLPAEAVHASGVLAVVALALYLSRFSGLLASSVSRLQGRVLWEMINFLLTGLSFVLIGLQLRVAAHDVLDRPGRALLVAGAVSLTIILVRPLWVFAAAWLSHAADHMFAESIPAPAPRSSVLAVISWAGMRGVVSLAVALSLPHFTSTGEPFPGRALIVFVTFAVILVTLIGQGLTLPLLIRRLGIDVIANRTEEQEMSIRLRTARAALRDLDRYAAEAGTAPEVVERVRAFYAERIEELERRRDLRALGLGRDSHASAADAATDALVRRLVAIERSELQRARNEGDVDGPVARRVQHDLDLM
ncbi:MAG TPA: Na+/H+ antiporter [Gemmatimonadaceae bacterium]